MKTNLKDTNLYYVGGVVRDEILGLPSFDIDFCYEGNAIEFAKHLNIIKTNTDFGTVKILYENQEIDIASTRTEKYPKAGHLPIINKIGCSLLEDLKRRDFSINAMAKNTVTNEVIDYFNGQQDIKDKKIRVLHKNSFIDDPTRILRALKFRIRFNFNLEKATKELQQEYLKNINYDMCYHRIKKELKETFNLNNENSLKIFIEENIFKLLGENQIIPKHKTSIEALVNKYSPNNIWLVYLGIFDLQNIELTKEEKTIIDSFNSIKKVIPQNDYETYKLFKNAPLESILLYANTVDYYIATNYLENLRKIKNPITGKDLQLLNIKQGNLYKSILEFSLEMIIKNPQLSKKEILQKIKDYYLC